MHYAEVSKSEYGMSIVGVNEDALDELNARLSFWVVHQTKAGLPVPKLESKQVLLQTEVADNINPLELSKDEIDAYLTRYSFDKIGLCKQALQGLLTEAPHSAVLVWRRDTARAVASLVSAMGYDVVTLTGDLTVKARLRAIDKASATEHCVIVATMDSISDSINTLVFVGNVIVFELQHKVRTFAQVLGRFCRLNSKFDAVSINWLLLDKTVELDIATRVADKISVTSKAIGEGATEAALLSGLESRETHEAWAQRVGALQAWGLALDEFGALEES